MNSVVRAPQLWWRVLIILTIVVGFTVGNYSSPYLTTITAWLVLGYELVCVWWMWTRRTTAPIAPSIRFGLTAWFVFIAIIAHVMLEHGVFPFAGFAGTWDEGRESLTKLLIHYVTPVLLLVDWLAFGPRRQARWRDLWWIAAVPFAYGLITVLRAVLFPDIDNRIPYPFMEPGDRGWGAVILTLLPMLVLIDGIAAILLGYDRLVGRRRRVNAVSAARADLGRAVGDAGPLTTPVASPSALGESAGVAD